MSATSADRPPIVNFSENLCLLLNSWHIHEWVMPRNTNEWMWVHSTNSHMRHDIYDYEWVNMKSLMSHSPIYSQWFQYSLWSHSWVMSHNIYISCRIYEWVGHSTLKSLTNMRSLYSFTYTSWYYMTMNERIWMSHVTSRTTLYVWHDLIPCVTWLSVSVNMNGPRHVTNRKSCGKPRFWRKRDTDRQKSHSNLKKSFGMNMNGPRLVTNMISLCSSIYASCHVVCHDSEYRSLL